MDSNLHFFSLPFVDSESSDLFTKKLQDCGYDDLQGGLAAHGSLLGADEDLAQFLSAEGPLEEPDLNGPTTLHCEICKKQFDNAKKYYGHLRIHSKDNLWLCDKCPNQKFSTKQHLMKHSLSHKPLERMWRCPQCSMAFEALWRLQQHLFAKHLDYRPHKCDVCVKAFHKLSDLKKHQDVHNGNMKHKCTVCEVAFKDKSNLKRHMLTHTNERPYCCPGCGHRFKQLASMKRHSKNCEIKTKHNKLEDQTVRKNYCKVCGMAFQYKSSLLEHCVRQHSNNKTTVETEKTETSEQNKTDVNPTAEHNIVDDILSAEDDYMTMSTHTEIMNGYNNQNQTDNDNLMQIEFLKEMNQLHALDDELFYNDIDFDNFQTSHIFNPNEIDYSTERNAEIPFDFVPENRNIDQDIMNALYHVKSELLPEDLLNVPEAPLTENESVDLVVNSSVDENNTAVQNSTVAVNECATIFESDVDLEASTNLAANLNQLIGENSVHYVSTEDDDTFIISLNSEIDAEQLTDMLNIEVANEKTKDYDTAESVEEDQSENLDTEEPRIVLEIIESTETTDRENIEYSDSTKHFKRKEKKQVYMYCGKCDKVFTKKDNYRSHIATHNPALRRYKCRVCGERFSYKSTLNKHHAKRHEPRVEPSVACPHCDKVYSAKWMVKNHIERDHDKILRHVCNWKDCGQKFYKKCDLQIHRRYHTGEKPHKCDICYRGFNHISHLKRHIRAVDCTKHARKKIL